MPHGQLLHQRGPHAHTNGPPGGARVRQAEHSSQVPAAARVAHTTAHHSPRATNDAAAATAAPLHQTAHARAAHSATAGDPREATVSARDAPADSDREGDTCAAASATPGDHRAHTGAREAPRSHL